MIVNVIIVDDELPAQEELKNILKNITDIKVIKIFDSATNVLEFISKNKTDIVFLDIEMPHITGIALAKEIKQYNKDIEIIFSTGYSQFAIDAFELCAHDYLLKPYTEERVRFSISRLKKKKDLTRCTNKITKIPIWNKEKLILVNPETDIYYIQADINKKILMFTTKGVVEINITLKELEDKLKTYNFLRTHKSFIVNMNKVAEIIPWFNHTYILKLTNLDDLEIPVSRHFLPSFKEFIGL